MPGTTVSPETRILAAQVKLKDPKTIAKIVAVLKRKAGNVQAAAEALGVSRKTLYAWTWEFPEFKAAMAEHSQGRGRVNLITFKGETKPLGQWAEELGHKPNTLSMRISNGVPLERALTPGPLREKAAAPAAKKKKARKKTTAPTP